MSAAETRQMSAVETGQGRHPVLIQNICLVPTADICPVSAADICPVSTEDKTKRRKTAAGRRPAAVMSSVETG